MRIKGKLLLKFFFAFLIQKKYSIYFYRRLVHDSNYGKYWTLNVYKRVKGIL
jgi:hypothetical protein